MKVSGLDVHKDTIFCVIYNGKKYGEVKEFTTFSEGIRTMGRMLQQEGVKKIAMESTGIYWIPVWNILEEAGFDLMYHGFGLTDQEYLKTDYKGSKVKKSEISNR